MTWMNCGGGWRNRMALAVVACVASSGYAATTTWNGSAGDNNWNNGANWTPSGVPGSTSGLQFSASATVGINTAPVGANAFGTSTIDSIYANAGIGGVVTVDAGGAPTQRLSLNGTLANAFGTSDAVYVGSGTLAFGTSSGVGSTGLVLNSATSMYVAQNAALTFGSNSSLTFAGGAVSKVLALRGAGTMNLGAASNISYVLSGDLAITSTANSQISGGTANDYAGTVTINGGTLTLQKTAGVTALAGNVVVNSGGTLKQTSSNQLTTTGEVTVNGGTWNLNSSTVSESVGRLTMNGGTVINGQLAVAGATVRAGTIGNTLTVGAGGLELGDGAAITGKTILMGNVAYTGTSTTATLSAASGISLNGARTFDVTRGSAGVDVAVTGSISDGTVVGSKLIKSGAGILRFGAANSYTGGTDINGGTLVITHGSALGTAGAVNVNAGGTLALNTFYNNRSVNVAGGGAMGGVGTYGLAFTAESGAMIRPGVDDGTNDISTLTFASGLTLNDGAVLSMDLGTAGADHAAPGVADLIKVTGNLTLGNNLKLTLESGAQNLVGNGSYKLLTYTGTLSGAAGGDITNMFVLDGFEGVAATLTLDSASRTIWLDYAAAPVPEAATLGMLGVAAGMMMVRRRAL